MHDEVPILLPVLLLRYQCLETPRLASGAVYLENAILREQLAVRIRDMHGRGHKLITTDQQRFRLGRFGGEDRQGD